MSRILSYSSTFHFNSLFEKHRRWIETFRTSLSEQDVTCEGIDQSESLLFFSCFNRHIRWLIFTVCWVSWPLPSVRAVKKVVVLWKLWKLDLFVSSISSWVKIYLNVIQKYVYLFSVTHVICRHVDNVWESSFKIVSGRVVAVL